MTIAEGNVRSYVGAGESAGSAAPFPKRQFGKDVAGEFLFDPAWKNLNNGSFGSIPRAVRDRMRHYQDQAEARPDQFIRWDGIEALDASRAAVAPLLGVPVETVTFVANATTGVNTVLRALEWHEDARDEVLYFDIIYGACLKTIDYVVELSLGRLSSRCVRLDYPCEDDEVVERFRAAAAASRAEGRRPRLALFDVVSSMPGLRFPFERVVEACREEGIISLVDGAQGIGLVDLSHLGAVDPDYFVTNAHKWLFAPRGCAVLYVPLRNQPNIRSTLPTSHGFVAKPAPADAAVAHQAASRLLPLRLEGKSPFLNNFQFIGTIDNSSYFCVKDAIRWRAEVLGGEAAIRDYVTGLAREGGKKVAAMLGTEILENKSGTLTNCGMINVALPVGIAPSLEDAADALRLEQTGVTSVISQADAAIAGEWVQRTLAKDYNTFVPIFIYKRRLWTRLSAQVYLTLDDFEFAGKTLQSISDRIGKQEFSPK